MHLAMTILKTLTDQESNIQISIITGIFALLGIIVAAVIARIGLKPKVPKKDPDEPHPTDVKTLSSYNGEQNEFMRLVIADSKSVHARLGKFESVVEDMKKERTQLIGAFSRYISKLVNSWGSGGKMPYPDEEDLKLLNETLPNDWRRRTQ